MQIEQQSNNFQQSNLKKNNLNSNVQYNSQSPDKVFVLQKNQQHIEQKSIHLEKKDILFNNYSYFAQSEYVPCHLIYTSEDVTSNSIYLGDVSSALDIDFIRNSNIKTVVTAGAQMDQVSFKNHKNQIKHIIYGVLDHKNQNLIQYFDEFYEIVQKAFHKGSILVHCAAGISRVNLIYYFYLQSSTLVISYLMKKKTYTFKQAIQYVRQRRPKVLPNLGFERQLKQYQKILLKQNQRKLKSKTSESSKHTTNKYDQIHNAINIKINQNHQYLRLNGRILQNNKEDFLQEEDEQNLPQISISQQRKSNPRDGLGIFLNNNNNESLENVKYKFKHNMFLNNFYYKNNKRNTNYLNHNQEIQPQRAYNLLPKNVVKPKSLLKNLQQNPYNLYKQQNKANQIQINLNNQKNMIKLINNLDNEPKMGNLLSPTFANLNKNNNNGSMSSAISGETFKNHTSEKNKNFRTSNHCYNHQQALAVSLSKDSKSNFPLFINKTSKKQLISINGLFDSAIIPIKYSQLPGRAQTDSTNRSPLKNEQRLIGLKEQRLMGMKRSGMNNELYNYNSDIIPMKNIDQFTYKNMMLGSVKRQSLPLNQQQKYKILSSKIKSRQNKLKTMEGKNLSLKPIQNNHGMK